MLLRHLRRALTARHSAQHARPGLKNFIGRRRLHNCGNRHECNVSQFACPYKVTGARLRHSECNVVLTLTVVTVSGDRRVQVASEARGRFARDGAHDPSSNTWRVAGGGFRVPARRLRRRASGPPLSIARLSIARRNFIKLT